MVFLVKFLRVGNATNESVWVLSSSLYVAEIFCNVSFSPLLLHREMEELVHHFDGLFAPDGSKDIGVELASSMPWV
jgi:hypothetical protein